MRRLGILGSGYLAKMIAQAADQFALSVTIFAQPQSLMASSSFERSTIVGDWSDPDLAARFRDSCDVITPEDKSIDASRLHYFETNNTLVFATPKTIEIIQDKLGQKRAMQQAGLETARFRRVSLPTDALEAAQEFGFPLILKARRARLHAIIRRAAELQSALDLLRGHDLIAEAMINFLRELSVVVIRGRDGEIRTYPVVEIVQRNRVDFIVRCPAPIDEAVAYRATEMAIQAVQSVEGVGAFNVRLFETPDQELILSEIASGPQRDGLYTWEGCITSQFENHVRAVMGLPLGDTFQIAPAVATVSILTERDGLLSSDALDEALATGGAHIHLYPPPSVRAGQAIGHITVLGYEVDGAEKVGRLALSRVKL